jgi:hypothetical protein
MSVFINKCDIILKDIFAIISSLIYWIVITINFWLQRFNILLLMLYIIDNVNQITLGYNLSIVIVKYKLFQLAIF